MEKEIKRARESGWAAVEEFTEASLLSTKSLKPYQQALQHTLETSDEAGLYRMQVSPSSGRFLQLQVQLMLLQNDRAPSQPFNVLEVGALGGYSAIWFASASPNVHVTSVEYVEKHVEVARANIEYAGVSDRVKFIHGAGMDVLPKLKDEVSSGRRPAFDFTFIDADKLNSSNYFALARDMSRKGACFVVDNVARSGWLANDELYMQGDGWAVGNRDVVVNVGQ